MSRGIRKVLDMKRIVLTLALVSALAVTGCAAQGEQNSWGMGNKQTVGTLGGAALGGIVGSNVGKGKGAIAATIVGSLLGAYAGSSIGSSLDRADMQYHDAAAQRAYSAPLNQQINWSNPESGNSGTITPIREGTQSGTGAYCREYRQNIMVGGKSEEAIGRACRNPDGTWTPVN